MAKNHAFGNTMRITIETAAAARTSGEFYDENKFHGVALHDAGSGVDYEMAIDGVWWLTLASVAQGDFIYVTAAGALTKTAGTNKLVGKAVKGTQASGPYTGKFQMLILPPDQAEAT